MCIRKTLLVLAAAFFSCVGVVALAVQPLEITDVYVDESDTPHQLIVTGVNLNNGGEIELWLGGIPLEVTMQPQAPDYSTVVANLPLGILDGSYQLVASTGGGTVRFDDFDGVTIGAEGPQGEQGLPGVDGIDGAPGGVGATGADGPPGERGPQGEPGQDGAPGTHGAPGDDGPPGPQGETVVGPIGPVGPEGPQGEQGPPGPEGQPGVGLPTTCAYADMTPNWNGSAWECVPSMPATVTDAICALYDDTGLTPKPTYCPEPGLTFAIAYINADQTDGYSEGDTLIARLVDTNGSGAVDVGDTVRTGGYPIHPSSTESDDEPFARNVHVISSIRDVGSNQIIVGAPRLGDHFEYFYFSSRPEYESYKEEYAYNFIEIADYIDFYKPDVVYLDRLAPSRPLRDLIVRIYPNLDETALNDNPFIDVDIFVTD